MTEDTRLEELVERCANARKKYEHDEIDYYEYLFDVQENEQSTWGVLLTFETFLEKCVGRPNPAKWTRYVRARKELGIERIRSIGIPAAFEVLEIEDPKRRRSAVGEYEEWSKQHHGVHVSEQYARKTRERIDPNEHKATPATNRSRELEQLRAENADLRREVTRLKSENQKLREQVAKSTPNGPAPKGGARKVDRNRPESRA